MSILIDCTPVVSLTKKTMVEEFVRNALRSDSTIATLKVHPTVASCLEYDGKSLSLALTSPIYIRIALLGSPGKQVAVYIDDKIPAKCAIGLPVLQAGTNPGIDISKILQEKIDQRPTETFPSYPPRFGDWPQYPTWRPGFDRVWCVTNVAYSNSAEDKPAP